MLYDLPCFDSRKSFYGKAKVLVMPDGERRLISYNTTVCSVDKSGHFRRHWGGYSATTMRHVNSFLIYTGTPGGGKSWWDKQKIQ